MGRGRVRVKSNHLPRIVREFDGAITAGVRRTSSEMQDDLKAVVWERSGMIERTIQDLSENPNHATIAIGLNRDKGFYSRFQEWGTINQAARPRVTPVAHQYEVKFPQIMAAEIRKVVRV